MDYFLSPSPTKKRHKIHLHINYIQQVASS